MIDDACRFLLEDEPRHCSDKLLWIVAVACKHLGLNPPQNLRDRAPRECRPRCNTPDQIIRHRTSLCAFQRARPTLAVGKARAIRHHAHIQIRLLTAIGDRVLETADTQLGIDMVDSRPYELSRVKGDHIGVLVIDPLPEVLKLFLIKSLVQLILRCLRRPRIRNHRAQHTLVIDCLHEAMDPLRHGHESLRQRLERPRRKCRAIVLRHMVIIVDVVMTQEVFIDGTRLRFIKLNHRTIHCLHRLSGKVGLRRRLRTIVQLRLHLLLQIADEPRIALARDHRQHIHLMHCIPQQCPIHPLSPLIDRETQASAHLLPLRRHTRRVLERTDLEHIRIVPALAQRRVGENHARRLIEREQPLLILQDQIIRRNIVRQIRAASETAVHRASRFLVNAEIARVYLLYRHIIQIFHICRIKNVAVFVHHRAVLLLEDPPVLPEHGISVCIILTVLRHLVDEEQRERLDPTSVEPLLLLKMRDNRLTDLHPPEIRLRYIPLHIPRMEHSSVQEKHRPRSGINRLHHIALVLRHLAREMAEVVPCRDNMQLTLHPALICHLELDPRTRRNFGREHDLREIEIAPRPRQILHLEPLHLDLLH